MRPGRGFAAVALVFGAVALATCIYPTERDAAVHVSITPIHILLRGGEAVATARAWQVLSATDSQPIPNVKFVWVSSNPLVASVNNEGRIVGVRSGTTIITAAATNFDLQANAGRDTLRVSAALEIDSVRPKVVRYGERLKIYGVGVDSILEAALGGPPAGTSLIRVPFIDVDYPNGTSNTQYWVPPPALTDSLFFLGIFNGSGVFGFVHDTTKVVEHDLYDPNATSPAALNIDGPGPFPTQLPALLFLNPALAFEALPRGVLQGADWFRFSQPTHGGRNLTFIIESPQLAGTFSTFFSDSLGWNSTKGYFIGQNSWTFGPGSHACHGLGFSPSEARAESTIVAFKGLPLTSLDAIAVYTQPGRYGLTVDTGYVSELPADKHEDDNSCNAADLQLPYATVPFRDTLAIENPHDIDWLRFTAPNPAPLFGVEFRLHAIAGASLARDSLKALDLYVIKVPAPGDAALTIVRADTALAPLKDHDFILTTLTPSANYYAVVLDFSGVTTYYEICVQAAPSALPGGPSCPGTAPFPAPRAAAPIAGASTYQAAPPLRIRQQPRRARLPARTPSLNPARP